MECMRVLSVTCSNKVAALSALKGGEEQNSFMVGARIPGFVIRQIFDFFVALCHLYNLDPQRPIKLSLCVFTCTCTRL